MWLWAVKLTSKRQRCPFASDGHKWTAWYLAAMNDDNEKCSSPQNDLLLAKDRNAIVAWHTARKDDFGGRVIYCFCNDAILCFCF